MRNATKALLECAKSVEMLAHHSMHQYTYESSMVGRTDKDRVINVLRSIEWSMGNGQCHTCFGSKPRAGWWTETVGHKKSCSIALVLKALGQRVVWEHDNHSRARLNLKRWSKTVLESCVPNP